MLMRFIVFFLGLAIFLSALCVVWTQYRSRSLFFDLEVERQKSQSLQFDILRYKTELSKWSQPSFIASSAHSLGLVSIASTNTQFIHFGDSEALRLVNHYSAKNTDSEMAIPELPTKESK